jgi:chromosome segregation ATPase
MSQTAKQIVTVILIVLLLAAVGVAGIFSLKNSELTKQKTMLSKQLDESGVREKNQLNEFSTLKEKFDAVEKEKNELVAKINSVGGNIDDIATRINDATRERDELKTRMTSLQKERDDLASKLEEKSKAVAQLAAQNAQTPAQSSADENSALATDETENLKPASPDDDEYWAKILKAKAELKMQLDQMKDELSKTALEVSDLKKQNSDLQLEISKLNKDKEAIAREIKYGNDLAKNLSIELARAQNEKKFMSDRMNKIGEENDTLHEQLKNLTSTKVGLEKNIVKLQGDKKQIEDKLSETEGVIQNRVEQIYQLKDTLEKDFKPSTRNPKTGEIELSPIVVNSDKGPNEVKAAPAGQSGSVVSINSDNNFVIVNLGEDAGVKIGDKLNVYRGAKYIAGLEVIQVRKDICAADIKSKSLDIETGDTVR